MLDACSCGDGRLVRGSPGPLGVSAAGVGVGFPLHAGGKIMPTTGNGGWRWDQGRLGVGQHSSSGGAGGAAYGVSLMLCRGSGLLPTLPKAGACQGYEIDGDSVRFLSTTGL